MHIFLLVVGALEASVGVATAIICCRQVCPISGGSAASTAADYLFNAPGLTLISTSGDLLLAMPAGGNGASFDADRGRNAVGHSDAERAAVANGRTEIPTRLPASLLPQLHPSLPAFLPPSGRRSVLLTQADTGALAVVAVQATASLLSANYNAAPDAGRSPDAPSIPTPSSRQSGLPPMPPPRSPSPPSTTAVASSENAQRHAQESALGPAPTSLTSWTRRLRLRLLQRRRPLRMCRLRLVENGPAVVVVPPVSQSASLPTAPTSDSASSAASASPAGSLPVRLQACLVNEIARQMMGNSTGGRRRRSRRTRQRSSPYIPPLSISSASSNPISAACESGGTRLLGQPVAGLQRASLVYVMPSPSLEEPPIIFPPFPPAYQRDDFAASSTTPGSEGLANSVSSSALHWCPTSSSALSTYSGDDTATSHTASRRTGFRRWHSGLWFSQYLRFRFFRRPLFNRNRTGTPLPTRSSFCHRVSISNAPEADSDTGGPSVSNCQGSRSRSVSNHRMRSRSAHRRPTQQPLVTPGSPSTVAGCSSRQLFPSRPACRTSSSTTTSPASALIAAGDRFLQPVYILEELDDQAPAIAHNTPPPAYSTLDRNPPTHLLSNPLGINVIPISSSSPSSPPPTPSLSSPSNPPASLFPSSSIPLSSPPAYIQVQPLSTAAAHNSSSYLNLLRHGSPSPLARPLTSTMPPS
ncbi:unnamed protein product [Protopolystoma xenopodis]|uniref:Uncharacterized protein n=1 Tax=Protopolystoma xenopodis TaxID=117903 RepID=A0A448WNR7_9PLAT|nr:unnamed protein product [Protopolystoma xenopodis]